MRILGALFVGILAAGTALPVMAEDLPGVTATEIKVGGIWPLSGPASAFGRSGFAQMAYVKSINDRGGINGRKINFIVLDDAYSPPKTVEQMRRLVEGEDVAFIHAQLGTPGNSATAKYVNQRKIPHTFIGSGATKFTDFNEYPYTTTATLSFFTEGKVLARFVKKTKPEAKVAIIYQNDDLGRDYVNGFKEVYGKEFDAKVVTASQEVTDPTIDSQIVNLKASNADFLVIASAPKAGAQAIRKARELGWKAQILVTQTTSTIPGTLEPAGLDNSVGVIATAYAKDPADPKYADDPEVKEYFAFMAKYLPNMDPKDDVPAKGYLQAHFLEDLLIRAGNDLSRENILKMSRSMPEKHYPMMLDGITSSTSATNNQMLTKMRLQQFDGKGWTLIGDIVSAD